jgi:hypothetical protein
MHIPDGERNPRQDDDVPQHPTQLAAQANESESSRTWSGSRSTALILLLVYALGLGTGYVFWGRTPIRPLSTTTKVSAASPAASPTVEKTYRAVEQAPPALQVNMPAEYTIPISYGDIGPQLLAAGAIAPSLFAQVYAQAGQPLTQQQIEILTQGSQASIVISRENSYFLLNFFWALGLTNQNPILEEGPMMQHGRDEVGGYASTGGWTIGAKPATALYSSVPIITLTPEQQTRLEEVAKSVYRPCCDNSTAFPDCNHGMAMLGLLELMASQDASVDEMFTAAKYANAFWFPQQTMEQAIFFKATRGIDFADVDARQLVGAEVSSGSGFRTIHQWLAKNNLLDQVPGSDSSCGV